MKKFVELADQNAVCLHRHLSQTLVHFSLPIPGYINRLDYTADPQILDL